MNVAILKNLCTLHDILLFSFSFTGRIMPTEQKGEWHNGQGGVGNVPDQNCAPGGGRSE